MNFTNTCTSEEAQKRACYQLSGHSTPFACMGSRCMAWRYEDLARPRFYMCDNPTATQEPENRPPNCDWIPFDPDDGESACWVEREDATNARRRGYCGMAGRPASPAQDLAANADAIGEAIRKALK